MLWYVSIAQPSKYKNKLTFMLLTSDWAYRKTKPTVPPSHPCIWPHSHRPRDSKIVRTACKTLWQRDTVETRNIFRFSKVTPAQVKPLCMAIKSICTPSPNYLFHLHTVFCEMCQNPLPPNEKSSLLWDLHPSYLCSYLVFWNAILVAYSLPSHHQWSA